MTHSNIEYAIKQGYDLMVTAVYGKGLHARIIRGAASDIGAIGKTLDAALEELNKLLEKMGIKP